MDKESSLKSGALKKKKSLEHLVKFYLMNFFRNDICCSLFVVVVQYLSHFLLLATPRTTACQASLSLTICQSLPKFMSIESVMPSNLSSATLFSFCLQSFPASGYFLMSQFLYQETKYWSFSISPSNEYSEWIYFRIDWSDLPDVQGTLKGLLQHQNSKTSVFGTQPS